MSGRFKSALAEAATAKVERWRKRVRTERESQVHEDAMRRQSACRHRLQQPFPASCQGGCDTCYPSHRKQRSSSLGAPAWGLLLFLLLAFWVSSCKGAPMVSHVLQGEQDLHLWNEIDEACSAYLAKDTLPQSSSALEELCFMILGLLQKMQVFDEKDNTKRFLFHYSKTHDTGNSNILSSVLHPLLQLVPHLHEKRLKRYKMDEELRIPGGIQSRGYFVFRPRNGRRSATFR